MHVAFITAYDPRSSYQVSLPPLGIGYLSAYLKQQCSFARTSFHHTQNRSHIIYTSPHLGRRRAARHIRLRECTNGNIRYFCFTYGPSFAIDA
ncbi:hypothetical protein BH09SUM1_BH09SUM1_00160 [soil metagenome]